MAINPKTRLFFALRALLGVMSGNRLSASARAIAHVLTLEELDTLVEILESADRRLHNEEEIPT